MSFFSDTGEAWGQMVSEPAGRANAARAAIEQARGRMESFLGHFDGFVVYTMPDAQEALERASAVSLVHRPPGTPAGRRVEYDALG